MIVVPLLTFLLGLEEKKAHATAIFIILPLCIISSVIYIQNGSMDWLKLLYSGIGFIIGGIFGALLLKKLNNKVLRIIFSVIMVASGIKLLFWFLVSLKGVIYGHISTNSYRSCWRGTWRNGYGWRYIIDTTSHNIFRYIAKHSTRHKFTCFFAYEFGCAFYSLQKQNGRYKKRVASHNVGHFKCGWWGIFGKFVKPQRP